MRTTRLREAQEADILLATEVGGSNYGATDVHSFRVSAGGAGTSIKLVEYDDAIAIASEYYQAWLAEESDFGSAACIGAYAIQEDDRTLLRLQMLKGYDPGVGETTAYYMDMVLADTRWEVQKVGVGEAYGTDLLIEGLKECVLKLQTNRGLWV